MLAVISTCVDLTRFASAATRPDRFCLAYIGALGTWYMVEEMLRFGAAAATHAGALLRFIVNDPGEQLGPVLHAAGLAPAGVDVTSESYDDVPVALAGVSATFAFIRPAPSKVASAAPKRLGIAGLLRR